MALGAQPRAVLELIMQQGLGVAATGALVGCVLALGAAIALSRALYSVSSVDPLAWAGAFSVLLSVSLLANALPAMRAARIDPTKALHTD